MYAKLWAIDLGLKTDDMGHYPIPQKYTVTLSHPGIYQGHMAHYCA